MELVGFENLSQPGIVLIEPEGLSLFFFERDLLRGQFLAVEKSGRTVRPKIYLTR